MLTPDYLSELPLRLLELSRQLEEYVIGDIARRISGSVGEVVTQTAVGQLQSAQSYGLDADAIHRAVADITQKGDAELISLFDDALREGLKYGNALIEQSSGMAISAKDPALFSATEAIKKQTLGEWHNITGSLGFAENVAGKVVFKPVAKFYQETLDFAAYQISTGVSDYNTAVRQAVKKMADSGLQTVDYASGHRNRIDVATRRAAMTGVSQLSGQIAVRAAEILGTTLMEITAHAGARPDHALWQGHVVDTSGKDARYLTVSDIGYGSVTGFKGANCRHDWYPFVEGVSHPAYTDKELAEIDPLPFEYNGKTYTAYDSTQHQRSIETAIRKSKRSLVGSDAAGDEEAYTAAAVKLRRQRDLYRDFSEAAKLPMQNVRAQELVFGRGQAARATRAAQRA